MSDLRDELGLTDGMDEYQVEQVIGMLRGTLEALPPDPESLGDKRLRGTLEAFLAGYALGASYGRRAK